jgi:hypothetical protein
MALHFNYILVFALGRYLTDEEIQIFPEIKITYDAAVLTYGDFIINEVNKTPGAYLFIDERVGYCLVGNFSNDLIAIFQRRAINFKLISVEP